MTEQILSKFYSLGIIYIINSFMFPLRVSTSRGIMMQGPNLEIYI